MILANSSTAYIENRQSFFNVKSDIALQADNIQQLTTPVLDEINDKKYQLHHLCEVSLQKAIQSVSYLPSSATFHLLFEVTDDSNHTYIVKTTKASFPLTSHNFHIDQWVMNLLRASNFPALPIYAVDCSRQRVDFDYLIMDKAQGLPLIQLKTHPNLFNQSIRQLGTYLAHIHSIPSTQFGLLDAEKLAANGICAGLIPSWKDFIFTRLDEHLTYCHLRGIVSHEQLATIKSIFNNHEHYFKQDTSCLLHGDLNDHNIFVHNEQLLVIDWEDAVAGDPIFDIALWGTFMHHHEKLDLFLEGYQLVGQLNEAFELLYWLYYLRIMLAKTVVRYKFEYYKTDKIPAIQRILPAIDEIKRLT